MIQKIDHELRLYPMARARPKPRSILKPVWSSKTRPNKIPTMILSSIHIRITTSDASDTTQLHKMSHELILICISVLLTCCIFNRVHEKKVEIDFDAASRAWRANKVYVDIRRVQEKIQNTVKESSTLFAFTTNDLEYIYFYVQSYKYPLPYLNFQGLSGTHKYWLLHRV